MTEPANIVTASTLDLFSTAVRKWFTDAFSEPTHVQEQSWESIARGNHTLVVAPTGSGKTLAAFLFAIDKLMTEHAVCAAAGEKWKPGVRVLYVSPLKALGADVERNLDRPLSGIADVASVMEAPVTVGMRTGDTPPDARRKLQRKPPDILITTPESLYLMLTSQARSVLSSVETVIVDEIHAMAGSKRGAHLSLSLERLANLTGRPFQRIGLSATVRPLDTVARFLGGADRTVEVVTDDAPPAFDLSVRVPVSDMTAIPRFSGRDVPAARATKGASRSDAWKSDRALRAFMREEQNAAQATLPPDSGTGSSSIWPYIEAAILDEVLAHTSTIVFVNSRGLCERLTARLNELYAKRCGVDLAVAETVGAGGFAMRPEMGGTSKLVAEPPEDLVIAKAHHGSVSKEKRLVVESELKRGVLPCVVATSSLELGIDMGEVDLVLQVAPPLSVSSGLQRIGRANHQVGGRSQGIMFPRLRTEVIDCAVISEGMHERQIERTELVHNALDVLAQQTVAAVAMEPEGLPYEEWFATVRRSACYDELPPNAFDAVLLMLAGRYAHGDIADFAPRIHIDPETNLLKPLARTQRLAVTGAGTIPDRGLFPVMLARGEGQSTPTPGVPGSAGASGGSRKQGRKRVGELDEEMVAESRVGDVIILGTNTWRITDIADDRVLVEPAPGRSARLPFWHGEGVGRAYDAGRRKGAFLREMVEGLAGARSEGEGARAQTVLADEDFALTPEDVDGCRTCARAPSLRTRLLDAGLNENAIENLVTLLAEQRNATGVVPSDEALVVEQCADEAGGWSMILHSPFGRRVHEPWALAIAERGKQLLDYDLQVSASDDGILMHIPLAEPAFPDTSLLVFNPDELEAIVRATVGNTALFATRFRECAARALLMTPTTPGKRAPLWQQRLRGGQLLEAAREVGDFPLLAEAARECLQEAYDLAGVRDVMERIGDGRIRLHTAQTSLPSPFAVPLLFGYMVDHLYEGDLPHAERQSSLLSVDSTLLGELVGGGDATALLDADAVAAVEAELQCLSADHQVRGIEGVAQLLRRLGPLTVEEITERLVPEEENDAASVLEALETEHRAFTSALGDKTVWVSADDGPRLSAVLGLSIPTWAEQPLLGARREGEGTRAQTVLAEEDAALTPNDVDGCGTCARAPSPSLRASASDKSDNVTLPHVISSGVGAADGVEKSPNSSSLIDGLVLRFAKTHGPFTTMEAASVLGLGSALVAESIGRLRAQGALVAGAFTHELREAHGNEPQLWIATDVLRRMRLRSLALAREAVKPVDTAQYLQFLFERQGVRGDEPLAGIDGVAEVITQFEGVALPKEAWETNVFPARVSDYAPAMLDELLREGEVIWQGSRTENGRELVAFFPTDSPFAPLPIQAGDFEDLFIDEPGEVDGERPSVRTSLVEVLTEESGLVFATLSDRVRRLRDGSANTPTDDTTIANALIELLWDGRVAVDGFAFVRTTDFATEKLTSPRAARELAATAPRHASSRRSRSRYGTSSAEGRRAARAQSIARSNAYEALAGRWSLIVDPAENDTVRAMTVVESLFDRYGIITSEVAATYGVKGGMSVLYPVLRSLEDAGEVLRGTFAEGLGNLQFAAQATIDELREFASDHAEKAEGTRSSSLSQFGDESSADYTVLAADDPAQLYGSVLPWPATADDTRPTRRAGALVVFREGEPVLYAAPHLKALLSFTADQQVLEETLTALVTFTLARLKRAGSVGARTRILIETLDNQPILDTPSAATLLAAGAVRDTHGLKLYASPF